MSKYKIADIPEYVPEMTFKEIGRELGLSDAGVMEIYTRAIKKLRKQLCVHTK